MGPTTDEIEEIINEILKVRAKQDGLKKQRKMLAAGRSSIGMGSAGRKKSHVSLNVSNMSVDEPIVEEAPKPQKRAVIAPEPPSALNERL